MGSIQRVIKRFSVLQMVAEFPYFMVAGGGNAPGLPFGTGWSLMSISISTFNVCDGAWGTSSRPWALCYPP